MLRLPGRSLEIMRKTKDLSGEFGTVGKGRAGGESGTVGNRRTGGAL